MDIVTEFTIVLEITLSVNGEGSVGMQFSIVRPIFIRENTNCTLKLTHLKQCLKLLCCGSVGLLNINTIVHDLLAAIAQEVLLVADFL